MKVTPEKLTAFCAALAETCQVGRACAAVGISRQTAYRWREEMPEFAEAWDAAKRIGVSALEDEAHRRAFEGVDKPVFYKGDECGSIREYSDLLAVFLLKAHDPSKYRENSKLELSGPDNGPVQLDDGQAAARLAKLLGMAQARKEAGEDFV